MAALVGFAATTLAMVGSWSVSLWSDEVATISAASRDPGDLGRLLETIDAVHGAYYALMQVWVAVFGASAFSVRLPSALAVGAATAGIYVLAARLAGRRTALAAAAALALLPRVTWAGIEARPYALSIALAVWATVALHHAVSAGTVTDPRAARRSWPAYLVYALTLSAGVLINLYVVLVVAAHVVTVLVSGQARRTLAPTIAAASAGVALTAPVVLLALGQTGQLGERSLGPLGLVRTVGVNQWFLGETPTPTTSSGATLVGALEPANLWRVAAVVLAVLSWGLVSWTVLRVVDARRRPSPTTASDRAVLRWAVPWLVVPTVLVLGMSLVSPSLYNPRYLGFSAPGLALLLGIALSRLRPFPAAATAAALAVLVAPVYLSQRTTTAKSGSDLLLVAEHLDGRTEPGDAVYFGPRDAVVDGSPIRRSLRTVSLGYPGPFEGLLDVTLHQSPADGATLFGTSTTLAEAIDRLADVDTLWVLRRQDRPADAEAEDAMLTEAGFIEVSEWDGPSTEVVELTRR